VSEVALILAGAALVLVIAVLIWLWLGARQALEASRGGGLAPEPDPTEILQREIEAVRTEGRAAQGALREEVAGLTVRVAQEIGGLKLAVAAELQSVSGEVARQLQEGMKLMQAAQTSMGERLDRAARVVGEVQGSLGRLGEATQRVVEVGKEIQGLEQALKSPKLRGGVGEALLEQLLAQMLPREQYELQRGFLSGEKVDAAIRIGDRLVPVDAKFPLENFRRLLAEPDEDRRRVARRAFARDVKARVEEIAKKYIVPDEGTFDFALMYVPAENVYYEIVIKEEEAAEESIAAYALSRRVIPVSPNTLYAYLQVIVLGLRGLRIEANARQIQSDLGRLGGDLGRVREHLGKLGMHLGNAQKQFVDAERDLSRVEAKIEAIERRGGEPALPEAGA
jgi:DNA recombination protein RmuC